jgi:primary-amine oxidase
MHSLDPLTPAEIRLVASLIKKANGDNTVHFKNIDLIEPPKKALRKYLVAERNGSVPLPALPRHASALYYHRGTPNLFVATVDLDASRVAKIKKLESRYYGQADMDEVVEVRDACLRHPKVIDRIKSYGLPDNMTVVCDTWPYGRDSDQLNRRIAQVIIISQKNMRMRQFD